jgi:hypothetical protein
MFGLGGSPAPWMYTAMYITIAVIVVMVLIGALLHWRNTRR